MGEQRRIAVMSEVCAVATPHLVECLQSLDSACEYSDIALAAAILSASGFQSIEELVGACAADLGLRGGPEWPGAPSRPRLEFLLG